MEQSEGDGQNGHRQLTSGQNPVGLAVVPLTFDSTIGVIRKERRRQTGPSAEDGSRACVKRVRLRTSRRVAGRFVFIGPEIGARVAPRASVLPLALVDSRGRRGAGQLVLLHFIFHLSSGHFTLVCSVDFAFFSLPGRNLFLFFSNSHTTL